MQRDTAWEQPFSRPSLFSTAGTERKWPLDMRPKQAASLFLHSPPPESFFSRTFRKPGQRAVPPKAASPTSVAQTSRESSTQPDSVVRPDLANGAQQSHEEQSDDPASSPAKEAMNMEPSAFRGTTEKGLSNGQTLPSALTAEPLREAEGNHQVSSRQDASEGVADKGVAPQRARHERVASLNAWSQDTAPNVARRSSQEGLKAPSRQAEAASTSDKGQKGSSGGFAYQNADAAGSFDFRLPPAPDQSQARWLFCILINPSFLNISIPIL